MKTKQIAKRGLRQRLDIIKYKMNLRAKLVNEPLELLIATKEEVNREIEKRQKQLANK